MFVVGQGSYGIRVAKKPGNSPVYVVTMKLYCRICIIVSVSVLLLGGCQKQTHPGGVPVDLLREQCQLIPGHPGDNNPVNISLADTVVPAHLPYPENESEEMIYSQLYQPLIQLDCNGSAYAGAALNWETDSNGRRWEFYLGSEMKWSDGSPVLGDEIVYAWEESKDNAGLAAAGYPWSLIESVRFVQTDELKLIVRLSKSVNDGERLFAHPSLCLYKFDGDQLWPPGTGPFAVSTSTNLSITCKRNRFYRGLVGGSRPDELRFRVRPGGGDPRDFLSDDTDVILTQDQRMLEYIAYHPEYMAIPLSWNRVYMFASPLLSAVSPEDVSPGADSQSDIFALIENELNDLKENLSRFDVRSDARPARSEIYPVLEEKSDLSETEFTTRWLRDRGEMAGEESNYFEHTNHIAYPGNDINAQLIAERFAGLASPRRLKRQVSSGSRLSRLFQLLFGEQPITSSVSHKFSPSVFHARLVLGLDRAYIFPLRYQDNAPAVLNASAAGLMNGSWIGSNSEEGKSMLPLVTCRSYLVVRRKLCGFYSDFYGTIMFADTGWKEGLQ